MNFITDSFFDYLARSGNCKSLDGRDDRSSVFVWYKVLKSVSRVATDLEKMENLEMSGNLKETSESQEICLKSASEFQKSGNFVV